MEVLSLVWLVAWCIVLLTVLRLKLLSTTWLVFVVNVLLSLAIDLILILSRRLGSVVCVVVYVVVTLFVVVTRPLPIRNRLQRLR